MYYDIDQDLKFGKDGDYSFIGNDLDTISSGEDILYQNIIDRLISNLSDYSLSPELGANLGGSIGKSNSPALKSSMKERIVFSLTYDDFMTTSDFSLSLLQDKDRMLIRIDVYGSSLLIQDYFKVTAVYNISSGLLYATN